MERRDLAMALLYGLVIGVGVGVVLESSGALVWLDGLVADFLAGRRPGRPARVLVLEGRPIDGRMSGEQGAQAAAAH